MKKIKYYITQRRIYIPCLIIFTFCILLIFYTSYENKRKQDIIDSMTITFTNIKNIEYGTKDFDFQKECIKEVKNAKIKKISSIDTMNIGEQKIKIVLTEKGIDKETQYFINVIDTKSPEVKFKNKSVYVYIGDEFDSKSNIEFVRDIIDGDINENDQAIEDNKNATEEYNKIKHEDIKENTKIAEKPLSAYLIEDTKDKEEKNLYLKNCYYINSDVDTSKQGEYTVHVIAIDKNGLKTSNKYEVIVKAKERQSQNTNNNSSNRDNDLSNYKNSPSDHSSISNKGSVYSVISTAQAQIGKPYVAGGRGPDTFDCEGLVRYAYAQNGYNIGIARSAGYSIGTDWTKAKPGDIIVQKNHVAIVVSLDSSQVSSGNGYYLTIVEAKNPTMGIKQTMMNLGPEQTIGILDIRRII